MHKRTAVRIAGAVIAAITSLGLAAPSQATSSTPVESGSLLTMWHYTGRGYYWINRDHSAHVVPGWRTEIRKCHTATCRSDVRSFYHGLHAAWHRFNHELWVDALSLPSCQTAPDANCVQAPMPGFTGVRLDGVTYYAQTDAVVG